MSGHLDQFLINQPFNLMVILVIDVFTLWLLSKVLLNNPKNKANRLFAAMSLGFLFWVNGGFFFAFSQNLMFASILGRIILGEAIWSFILLYFFLLEFPVKLSESKYTKVIILLIGTLFSSVTIFTNAIVENARFTQWGVDPVYSEYGKFFYYFAIFLVIIFSIVHIFRKYPHLDRRQKTQVQLFFLGIFIFLAMNLIFNVAFPVIRNSIKYWQIGNWASIVFISLATYSVVKKQLLNTRVVAAEALVVVIWLILFAEIFNTTNLSGFLIDIVVLSVATLIGSLLVRSVNNEVHQKEQLQVLTNRLKELDARKDEFLNVAAHELRAPMTAIKGYLSMLQEEQKTLTPDAKEYLSDAVEENDRLVRLVNNMLNVSRIEEGRMTFEMGTLHLNEVVETDFKQFTQDAKEKGLDYTFDKDEAKQDSVYVDIDRIHEVVSNLISNAIKYTDKGKVSIKLTNPNQDTIRLEVSDTGAGLSSEEKNKLFHKFYRADSSTGKKIGTGLGLYISKLLINHFGGTIDVESTKGEGSTFWFELPVKN